MENRFCRKLNKADEYDSMVVLTMMIIMPCAISYLMLFKVHLLTKLLVWGSYGYAYIYIYQRHIGTLNIYYMPVTKIEH